VFCPIPGSARGGLPRAGRAATPVRKPRIASAIPVRAGARGNSIARAASLASFFFFFLFSAHGASRDVSVGGEARIFGRAALAGYDLSRETAQRPRQRPTRFRRRGIARAIFGTLKVDSLTKASLARVARKRAVEKDGWLSPASSAWRARSMRADMSWRPPCSVESR